MKPVPLAQQGVFWTLQGEGALQGTPMAFVRLAGCSVGCPSCDTDYRVHRRVSLDDLVVEIRRCVPESFANALPWVWLTGGEPTDHDLGPLIARLHVEGYRVALATAGVRAIPPAWNVNWISVSPHAAGIVQTHGHEVKIVPNLNGLTWETIAQESRMWAFGWKFLQPHWYQTANGPERDGGASWNSLQECIAFVLANPGWQLTTQAHKAWRLP